MKLCRGCERILDESAFTRNSRAADGLEWRCRDCKRDEARRYYLSDKGRQKKRAWAESHKDEMNARRTRQRHERFGKRYGDNPVKVRARILIGKAVRRKYMVAPNGNHWWDRWEFHHPDHTRPYYGVWILKQDHDLIEHGLKECPPCADYTEDVKRKLLGDWGLE